MTERENEDLSLKTTLSSVIEQLLPSLERFSRFDTPERTAYHRAQWVAQLSEALPEQGVGAEEVVKLLRDVVIPNGLQAGHPGFSGWVATMPTPLPTAAHLASAIAAPLMVGIQAFNLLEEQAVRWLAELLGLPERYQGLFTSAGTIANLIGIGAARQATFERQGRDVGREGLPAQLKPRLYTSTQTHHWIYRAASVFGFGRQAVVTLPVDRHLRMDCQALKKQIAEDRRAGYTPIAVSATAGTVYSGAIDPLPELVEICREQEVWLHVDGAYGLLGILDPQYREQYGSLAEIDSLVVDPHKWLATPMGCGGVFVRDKQLLGRAFTMEPAAYLEDSQPGYTGKEEITSQFDELGYSFREFGFEHSPPTRGVEVWAVLKEIGVEGVRERICRHNGYARHLAEGIEASPTLELVAPYSLSTCCYRYVPEELAGEQSAQTLDLLNGINQITLGRVRARSRCMPSATFADGAFALRSCFINPRTQLTHIDTLLAEVEICGKEVWEELKNQGKV